MDWLKWFILLVAVISVRIKADGPKKKIRIHLPQKVKHIHHHKKIYITNHSAAPSQYAPAFLPSAEGAIALPTNIALPAVANIIPFNSAEDYENVQQISGSSPTSSRLSPLYRARGYYGPNPNEWDEQDYDLIPPPKPTNVATPTTPKRVKMVKLNEIPSRPRKKSNRKPKSHRTHSNKKPQTLIEEEHPVSTFHEHFYSDLEDAGTVRKIKRPQRVEKIIDGDTEHIHTYSEEHIHKVLVDDGYNSNAAGLIGYDSIGSMSAISAPQQIFPVRNGQTLLALSSDPYTRHRAIGSMGTPSYLEYTAYNPSDVTHDHIFHDHGEILSNVDITKDSLSFPPKVSYNSQGMRIKATIPRRYKGNSSPKYLKPKPTLPTSDFSYYESIYTPNGRSTSHSTIPSSADVNDNEFDDFVPSYVNKRNPKPKVKQYVSNNHGKPFSDFHSEKTSVPSPFSLSDEVVHNYKPKPNHATAATATSTYVNFKDPLVNFKDPHTNNYNEYDTFASSSNLYPTEDKLDNDDVTAYQGKQSVSTQKVSFGVHDHHRYVDHFGNSETAELSEEHVPTAIEDSSNEESKVVNYAPSTPFTIREKSPAHHYYTSMAKKALHGDLAEASSDKHQYVEAPTVPTTAINIKSEATTSLPYNRLKIPDVAPIESTDYSDIKQTRRKKIKNVSLPIMSSADQELRQSYFIRDKRPMQHRDPKNTYLSSDGSAVINQLKYGDKI